MSGITSFTPVAGAAASGSRLPLTRVEKASESSGLQDDTPTDEERRENASRRPHEPRLSHSGTGGASRWNGPKWSAPFVAQILGQVLTHHAPDTASARAAYARRTVVATGIGIDREV
jgi:hypothetical protein